LNTKAEAIHLLKKNFDAIGLVLFSKGLFRCPITFDIQLLQAAVEDLN
jgi:hypothetical protein